MFSVIIPVYNKQSFILNTIKSVLNQTFKNFELIIINDGSTDNSFNLINAILDSRIKIINIDNSGVSNARNIGIINSKYEWVALLDADDLWEDMYLQEAYNYINTFINCRNIFVYCTNFYKLFEQKKVKAINAKSDIYTSYFDNPFMTSSSIIIHKEVFDKVGYFNSNLNKGEDIHLWLRINMKYNFYFNECPLVYYRMGEHQSKIMNFDINFNKNYLSILNTLSTNEEIWNKKLHNYILNNIKPYYVFNYSDKIKSILENIPIRDYNIKNFIFYKMPKFLIDLFYRKFFILKYLS